MRAAWRLTEAVILSALATVCYRQHLLLKELDLTLSQTVQASDRANALVAAREKEMGELRRSLMTVTTEEPAAGASGNNGPGEKHLDVWIQKVRLISDFAARHPELMVPQIALLQEQDWLDIARDKLESEADFKSALAKLRDLGRRRAAPVIGNALKTAINAANGRIPDSPRDLIPYLPTGFNPAVLDRMIIDPAGPIDERIPTRRFVLMERPVDASDRPLMFNSFGSHDWPQHLASERTTVPK